MPLIDKASIPVVEVNSMNEVHYQEVDMLNELDELLSQYANAAATPEQLDEKLDAFFAHMKAHFKAEEVQMEAINFPPYPVHQGEHENTLQIALQQILNWKESRNLESISNYIRVELPQWLDQHIATMDRVTAHFFAMAGKEVTLEIA